VSTTLHHSISLARSAATTTPSFLHLRQSFSSPDYFKMFSKSFFALVALALAVPEQAFARYRWMERDGAAVMLHPRRFGQEHPQAITDFASIPNCPGQVRSDMFLRTYLIFILSHL
jgi:hypothetical protein